MANVRTSSWRLGFVASTLAASGANAGVRHDDVRDSVVRTSIVRATVADDTSSVSFWTRIGDRTLVQLITLARARNQDVHAAVARVSEARAQRRLAGFDFVPTVTSAAGFSRVRYSATQLPGVPYDQRLQNAWDVGLTASWEVDLFGRIR